MVDNRLPGAVSLTDDSFILDRIERRTQQQQRENHVQFNLGGLPKNHLSSALPDIPGRSKTGPGLPDLKQQSLYSRRGTDRASLNSVDTPLEENSSTSQEQKQLSRPNHYRTGSPFLELIKQQEEPLSIPKTKMKTGALNKRNLSKVAYTFQAKIRPSSPSYMSSTSASRNRTSKLSTSTNSSNTPKLLSTTVPSGSSNQKQGQEGKNLGPTASQSSHQSGGSILDISQSRKTVKSRNSRRKRSRFRLSLSHNDVLGHHSPVSVAMKEKFLMKIFSHLSWNELIAIRRTCKKWYEIIQTPLKKEAVIILRWNLEGMAIFNKSMYVWTQFRIFVSVVFDFTDAMQQEFWTKHGKTMTFLEIRNSSITLSALVQILFRCPNLEHFSVTWSAEMFGPMLNSEVIKKYYGIHFRNGTFAKLHELSIDKSYFLTDNALWSLLKWCGGSIRKLSLTCDKNEDFLGRLKPRWSIEPIQNYCSRFGYSGNFKFLDFNGSNLNSEDLKTLANTEKLNSLIGIRLSNCKISDEAIVFFIREKGANLEEFHVDSNQISEKAFEGSAKLQKLKSLNISGKKGNFRSLDFLKNVRTLEEFLCCDTNWLTYSTIAKGEALGSKNSLKKLDISSSNNIISKVDQRMNKIWFSNFTNFVPRLTELNLNYCGVFGNDDNFKAICTNILTMEKLSVRDWTALTDEALVGMTFDNIIKQYDDVKEFWKSTDSPSSDGNRSSLKDLELKLENSSTPLKISPLLCNLKHLKYLDLGECKKLTDICVQFAIIHLPRLTKLGLDKTQITDASYHLLVSKTSKLEKLCLVGCEHITPKANLLTRNNGRLIFIGKL